ncbi:SAM-dependent methyltransferase [Candidatus Symbiobacter mobilis CR]|uniref:site-specific DNA-methyltransferase (adenine-specific) n=2 Tax=Candidatus Symbiobacter TaxID=1436289 RepID=U5NAV6_9BURK|nr:SAM-dependent methyltransferase [Candidatus Symbiobacter mobilis CR]
MLRPMKTSSQQQVETRFVELMTELFQMEEAQALDFGIYRVIRRHNREVQAFLGKVRSDKNGKWLEGGKLSTLLNQAFLAEGQEEQATDKFRLKELEQQLGIRPGMTQAQREEALSKAESFPALQNIVAEYQSRIASQSSQQTVQQDRTEVLNRLYQFFSRHYQDGDFIVERRYGKSGARYIRSTGEDTEFHWATEGMYYIKSGDIFTDFPVQLANGKRLVFTVEPDSLQATRAALKPNDRAHYALHNTSNDGQVITVCLQYRKGAQSEKQKDEIVAAVQKAGAGGSAETVDDIRRWLHRFVARNQSDFFIHKRLQEALTEDLDLYIKVEVIDVDQLLAGAMQRSDLPLRTMKVARLVREIGLQIIGFLAALEDFQKSLLEKKKLVFETRYVITLDRLERYCPEWLAHHIDGIVQKQKKEWKELGFGEYDNASDCLQKTQGDLVSNTRKQYLPLPIDTHHFNDGFKWSMLGAMTMEESLDDALDGVAIQSDNWQALHTLSEKYREKVKCIYIDPPYNKGGDGFPYKDAFQHASWIAMIHSRLEQARHFMPPSSAIYVSIDENERDSLLQAMNATFGANNRVEEIVWGQNTTKNQSPTFSTNHEYVAVYTKDIGAAKADKMMFRESKPGAGDVLELMERINPGYPTIAEIEKYISDLYKSHIEELKAEFEDAGEEYKSNLDPWRGLFNYKHAEYRDENGMLVTETSARTVSAKIWVWREDNLAQGAAAGQLKEDTKNPNSPNYRYYTPHHPDGHAIPADKIPKTGWRFPYEPLEGYSGAFTELVQKDRIVWGNTHKDRVPQIKRFLHDVDTQVAQSVVLDYSDGEKDLTKLLGKSKQFPNPKPASLVARFVAQASGDGDWVMDFFAGSGTTWQAVANACRDERVTRKVLLVEGGKHFEPILLKRIKKLAFGLDWKSGLPIHSNGKGLCLRVQSLEQYDDTLANLHTETEIGGSGNLPFQHPAFSLQYRLNSITQDQYCGVERFTTPFGYQLQRAAGGGKAQPQEVDLVESIPYLLGLHVDRLYWEEHGVVLLGRNRRGQAVTVLFRYCAAQGSAEWVQTKMATHPADRFYTNDPASLFFEGCDRFEAIESIFALQFGKNH